MRRRRNQDKRQEQNGFAEWGGYLQAKKAKLEAQFHIDAANEASSDISHIFGGVAIFVNGYSVPSAEELKLLMMKHGGEYHHYYRSDRTTHIIATNLPDSKVKQLKTMNIVRPEWVVDSIAAGRLLDYRQYLLYSHQSTTQPKLTFGPNSSDTEYIHKDSPSISKITKTASEAGFLTEFYNNSRLHHISTMGSMFKQYVYSLREKSTGVYPGMEKLKVMKRVCDKNKLKCGSVIIMHIDMDCFFVSVGLRKRPELKGFPVAVTHAKSKDGENSVRHRFGVNRKAEFGLYKSRMEQKFNGKNQSGNGVEALLSRVEAIDESDSMSEIASCNYEARTLGLKNGMFLGQALKLCPTLKTIPYDFEEYKEVSQHLYDTVASYTVDIEAVSCDEMFVDCTTLLNYTGVEPLEFASQIRAEIKQKTSCPCSTGFGANRLQARLATKRAKPNGQLFLQPTDVQSFMAGISVEDLPGVGRSTKNKLATMGVKTCIDLQLVSLKDLQAEFGMKIGDSLYKHCRGEDTKKLVFNQVRKSVSAEVNYGIRFKNMENAVTFLKELSKEVHKRLVEVKMKTKYITLKLMVRAKDAPQESAKFLGHGICEHISRSSSLQAAVFDVHSITREVLSLHQQLNIEPSELRGVGIQLLKLEDVLASKTVVNPLNKFLRPKSEIVKEGVEESKYNEISPSIAQQQENKTVPADCIDNFFQAKKKVNNQKKEDYNPVTTIKPADIDRRVLSALPEDIRKEVMQEYGLIQKLIQEINDPPAYDHVLNYSQIDLEVLEELPDEIRQEIQSTVTNKSSSLAKLREKSGGSTLDRNVPPREVRGLIKAWTEAEHCPQSCDTDMLVDYMLTLISDHHLDVLDECVHCLHRCIERRQSLSWQSVYFGIIATVQRAMKMEYRLQLLVPNTFQS